METVQDVVGGLNLTGRQALVTGANSGIGLETAVFLARAGATVHLGCRNPARAKDAAERISQRAPGATVDLVHLDLGDLASVRTAAQRYLDGGEPLDLLINSAGVMAVPKGRTVDGFETHSGVDHLGHFALTGLLLPALSERPRARVVTVSSLFAVMGSWRVEDLRGERRYERWSAYAGAKLANLYFATELDRRLRAAGSTVASVAAHPGFSHTELVNNGVMSGRLHGLRGTVDAMMGFMGQPADWGALPSVYAATSPDVVGGDYIGPSRFAHLRGTPEKVALPRAARDQRRAARLWTASVAATGVDYASLNP